MSNGFKNILFGLLAQVVIIGLGVFVPRLVLVHLGSESNGLLASVGNMMAYLSLLEAGVGTATLQALYRPVFRSDRGRINGILAATHHFYRRTGIAYLVCVLVLAVAYALFVRSELPRWTVFGVILLSGLSSVLSFFFQGKYCILLQAEGKGYVITNVSTMVSVGASLSKIALLVSGFDVLAISAAHFVLNGLQTAGIVWFIRRRYGWIDLKVAPDFGAIAQRNAVLVHQISGLIFSNTDVLLLTMMTDLRHVSVYNMYAMMYGMVKSIVAIMSNGYTYALGQRFHDADVYLKWHDVYEIVMLLCTFSLFGIAYMLMMPFMTLYTSGVHDIDYVDGTINLLFLVFYLLHNARASSGNVINFAGRFRDTAWRSILESCINLASSIVLIHYYGIYGALGGTIIALTYRSNDMIIYASRIIHRSSWYTYRRILLNSILLTVFVHMSEAHPYTIHGYDDLFVYAIGLSVITIPVFILCNVVFEWRCASMMFDYARRRWARKRIGKRM